MLVSMPDWIIRCSRSEGRKDKSVTGDGAGFELEHLAILQSEDYCTELDILSSQCAGAERLSANAAWEALVPADDEQVCLLREQPA